LHIIEFTGVLDILKLMVFYCLTSWIRAWFHRTWPATRHTIFTGIDVKILSTNAE
jgi:hypothetical protein